MTEARLIDGLTGELIGGQSTYLAGSSNVYTTQNSYQTGYKTAGGTGGVYTTASQGYTTQAPQVVNTIVNTGK